MANILVCVGSDYLSTQNELKGCINDLRDLSYILGDFETVLLTDPVDLSFPGKILELPTKNNILSHWQKVLSNAKPGDNVIFYYSGHGAQMTDESDTVIDCLVPLDAAISKLEHDRLITSYDLYQLLIQTPVNVKVLFLADSCFSDIAQLQTQTKGVSLKQSEPFKHLKMQLENTPSYSEMSHGKITLIAGCKATKGSAILGNGALTYALISWIKQNSVEAFLSHCWDYSQEGLPNLAVALAATVKGKWVTEHDLQISFVEDTSATPTLTSISLPISLSLRPELPEPLTWAQIWGFLGGYFHNETRLEKENFSDIVQWLVTKFNEHKQISKFSNALEEGKIPDENAFKKPHTVNLEDFLVSEVTPPITPILDSKKKNRKNEEERHETLDEKKARKRRKFVKEKLI